MIKANFLKASAALLLTAGIAACNDDGVNSAGSAAAQDTATRVNSERGGPAPTGTDGIGDASTSTNNDAAGGNTPSTAPNN